MTAAEEQVGSEPAVQPNTARAKLAKLAADIAEGRVFGSWDVPAHDSHMIGMLFMPIMFGGKIAPNAAHVYEYLSEAGPRGVNGYPVFFSCHTLTTEDMPVLGMLVRKAMRNKARGESRLRIDAIPEWHKRVAMRLSLPWIEFKAWHWPDFVGWLRRNKPATQGGE